MHSKQFKALTVVLLTMAVATPEMTVPAAAFLPAQVGSTGQSGMKLDNFNLLTEVDSGNYWRKRRHGSNNFNGGNYNGWNNNGWNNNGWNNNNNNGWRHRRHRNHNNNDWPYYALAFGLGYGLGGYGGGYGYNDGYYGGGGGGHVEWCLNRYRSYNPRTNLFKGYDGYYHQCNSPY
jgi:BA14K-like protein